MNCTISAPGLVLYSIPPVRVVALITSIAISSVTFKKHSKALVEKAKTEDGQPTYLRADVLENIFVRLSLADFR